MLTNAELATFYMISKPKGSGNTAAQWNFKSTWCHDWKHRILGAICIVFGGGG